MYLAYVDESGDPGHRSRSNFFVLSALVVHELDWLNVLDEIIEFRRNLKARYNLKMSDEIHAGVFINGRCNLSNRIPRNTRLLILRRCLEWLQNHQSLSIITVRVDKRSNRSRDIFEWTWRILMQRIENTLSHRNFPRHIA
jgi:uncharacterized protein DUF3800